MKFDDPAYPLEDFQEFLEICPDREELRILTEIKLGKDLPSCKTMAQHCEFLASALIGLEKEYLGGITKSRLAVISLEIGLAIEELQDLIALYSEVRNNFAAFADDVFGFIEHLKNFGTPYPTTQQCPKTHSELIAGTCPWCGQDVDLFEPSKERQLEGEGVSSN